MVHAAYSTSRCRSTKMHLHMHYRMRYMMAVHGRNGDVFSFSLFDTEALKMLIPCSTVSCDHLHYCCIACLLFKWVVQRRCPDGSVVGFVMMVLLLMSTNELGTYFGLGRP